MKNKYLLVEVFFILSIIIRSQSNHQNGQSNSYSDSLFSIGEIYFLENNFEKAEKMFTEYLVIVPNDIRSLEYLSQISIAHQDIPSLKFYCEKILSLNRGNIDALLSLGVIYFNDGQYDKAQDFFLTALQIESNNELVLYNLGVLYLTIGDFHNAEITLNKAIQINPQNGTLYQALGFSCLLSQRYEESERYLIKAISIDQNLLEAKKGLVILYQNLVKLEESLKYINEIKLMDPNFPQLNLLIANQKFMIGETDTAIIYALKEIDENPNQADVYYLLSTLYSLNGEELKSQNVLAKAEKLLINKNVGSPYEMTLKPESLMNSLFK